MTTPATPKRVAIVGFAPGVRPVPRDLSTFIEGLVVKGVDVDLLLPPRIREEEIDLGANVGRFALDIAQRDTALAALKRYINERRPDFLLSNRDRASALLARLPLGQRPYRIYRIGTNVLEKTKAKHLLARWRVRRQLAETLASADLLIGVSDGACSAIRGLLRGRKIPPISRVYSPIDGAGISRLAREPIAHVWLTDKKLPVVLSVGRLVRTKDYPTLLKAFRRVLDTTDCRLLVLGEGRQRRKLETLIQRLGVRDSVDLLGFVPNPFPYMARADLVVLSSIFEGFGNVLAESLAVGTPCVATDCKSGPREILADGRYGELVPVGDTRALADAIVRGLAHPPQPERLQEAVARFDRDRVVEDFLRALGTLLA